MPDSNPREMLDALSRPFPPQAIEQRKGGGGTFAYVATETVIRRLNAVTPSWDCLLYTSPSPRDS